MLSSTPRWEGYLSPPICCSYVDCEVLDSPERLQCVHPHRMYKPAIGHFLSHGAAQQTADNRCCIGTDHAACTAVPSTMLKTNTTGNRTAAKECANFVILFLEMMLEAKIARYCIYIYIYQSCQHLLSTVL